MPADKKNYPCSETELYFIARLSWGNCLTDLPSFQKINTLYHEQYINCALEEIEAAEELREEAAMKELALNRLKGEKAAHAKECIYKWQLLRRHIQRDRNRADYTNETQQAGAEFYPKACLLSHGPLTLLMQAGLAFLERHQEELLEKGMHPDFKTQYESAFSAYTETHADYTKTQLQLKQAILQSRTAHNNLYSRLQLMLEFGRLAFENEVRSNDYVFSRMKAIVV